jgi:hypothetical protein
MPALRGLRQEDCKLEASLSYVMSSMPDRDIYEDLS